MRQVTVAASISAPRGEIFDFVADLATRPAYTDHYLEDYRLARVNPYGVGAAARFRVRAPFAKEYAELEISECSRPRRIVEEMRIGRLGRNHSLAVYDFIPEPGGVTRVELATYSEPATRIDALKQLGAARWAKRQTKIALERLRLVFEEPPPGQLARATVAAFEPEKAARFGAPTGMDPGQGVNLGPAALPRPETERR
jgi:polyketide cyclase/dehydrase/lipid transport protein